MAAQNDEILERLDRLEVAVGQIAFGVFGPSVGGSVKSPLLARFVQKFEARRDQQAREARVAAARREYEAAAR